VKSVHAVVISEATTVIIPEVSVTTLASKEPAVGHVSAFSEMVYASTETASTIIERGSGSASTKLALAMDIMEELAHQMVQLFFTSMKSCIELVLFGKGSFKFARMLLENQIKNIRHTGSSDQAEAYLTLVKQLGICLKELKTLKSANLMDEARLVLNKLLAAQECERKEIEEQMAEEA